MTQRVLILTENVVDGATLAASSHVGDLVPENVQNARLSQRWRTAGATGEWLRAMIDGAPVDTFVMLGHNMTTAATIRLRLSNNSDMSDPIVDISTTVWAPISNWEGVPWERFLWEGVPDLERGEWPPITIIRLGAEVEATYLRIDLEDAANPAGYLEVGRIFTGVGQQPLANFSYGWALGTVDPTEQEETDGGDVWFDLRPRYRQLDLPFNFVSQADALNLFQNLTRVVGHRRDLVVLPFPDADAATVYRTCVYGFIPTGALGRPQQTRLNRFTMRFSVREITG